MTLLPIHTASPAELRGYALGLRETSSLLAITWAGTGMVEADDVSLLVTATREAWEREAVLVEGFAARLEAAEAALAGALRDIDGDGLRFVPESMAEVEAMLPPTADPPRPVTAERVAAWAQRFEAAALRTVAQPASAAPACAVEGMQCLDGCTMRQDGRCARDTPDQPRWFRLHGKTFGYGSLREAYHSSPELDPVPIESSEWDGLRWATAPMASDGEPCLAETREEALAWLADSLGAGATATPEEATQAGLADAVAESLASLPAALEKRDPLQRSDSPWTKERLALLAQLVPTVMKIEAVHGHINALPGLPVASPEAVRIKAAKMGIYRQGLAIPDEFLGAEAARTRVPQMAKAQPAEPPAPIVPAGFIPLTTEEMHNLRESFRKKEFGVTWLAEEYGMPPDKAQEIVNQLRAEQAQRKGKAA